MNELQKLSLSKWLAAAINLIVPIISERQHLCSHRGRQRVRRSVAGADEVRQVGGHPREEQGTFKTSFCLTTLVFAPNFYVFIVKC